MWISDSGFGLTYTVHADTEQMYKERIETTHVKICTTTLDFTFYILESRVLSLESRGFLGGFVIIKLFVFSSPFLYVGVM